MQKSLKLCTDYFYYYSSHAILHFHVIDITYLALRYLVDVYHLYLNTFHVITIFLFLCVFSSVTFL